MGDLHEQRTVFRPAPVQAQDDRARLRSATDDRAAALAAIEPLMQQAGVSDLDALAGVVERSRARRHLLDGIARLERDLLEAGDGLTLRDLQAEAEDTDRDGITG
ncbi:MAG TPA: hypothetical protein PLK38_05785, partial [Methanoregulaceae archaeon]|nr:hypothetical protein [Methanoregulaceae archaeon]